MLSLQKLVEIAARHFTTMADAMVAACVAKAVETGEALDIPERGRTLRERLPKEDPTPPEDWERMVRTNSDTRRMHQ